MTIYRKRTINADVSIQGVQEWFGESKNEVNQTLRPALSLRHDLLEHLWEILECIRPVLSNLGARTPKDKSEG